MKKAPEDLDIQAYCRRLALQQVEMLTRLAEMSMQLGDDEGARALAAEAQVARARAAGPKADEARAGPSRRRQARPAGSPATIRAIRARRRDAVIAAVERDFAKYADPALIPALRAGLAVRLQEPDVVEMLDTETIATAADRLCRSLGLGFKVYKPEAADTE
jgi:hypothetical protein